MTNENENTNKEYQPNGKEVFHEMVRDAKDGLLACTKYAAAFASVPYIALGLAEYVIHYKRKEYGEEHKKSEHESCEITGIITGSALAVGQGAFYIGEAIRGNYGWLLLPLATNLFYLSAEHAKKRLIDKKEKGLEGKLK